VTRPAAALLALAIVAAAGCGSSSKKLDATLPVVVLESRDAPSWVRLMRTAGFAARDGDLKSMLGRQGGIVPADADLTAADRARIVDWVKHGGRLATGQPELLGDFDIHIKGPVLVSAATIEGLKGKANWLPPLTIGSLYGTKELQPLAQSTPGKEILMAAHGNVTAFALDPVADFRIGYELLPEAAAVVGERLGAPKGPTARGGEVFVDPGGLHDSLKASPAKIADLLVQSGARIAHVAGWNYDFNNPADDYDYAALIRALHRRGILAYAWLEPPFVTLRMWQDYPQCHEKTETGREAIVDWRSLIALEDPKCFDAAAASWRRVLTKFGWDGVNVAELYFEPRVLPRNFTPFSKAALQQFGKDPKTHPAEFLQFREQLATDLNRKVLQFVSGLPNADHLGVELTVIDNTLDPELGLGVGSNVEALAKVAAKAGATLVVEDPHTLWAEGPLRYVRLGKHVKSLMPPEASLLDINVVPRYQGSSVTAQMTGAELALAVSSAADALGKVGIYALGTLPQRDLVRLPGAMAGGTATTDLGVFGSWTVTVTAPSDKDTRLKVDGHDWPAAGSSAVVPAGNHLLEWSAGDPAGPGLKAFTGQLGTAGVSTTSIHFTYDARPDALAIVTQRPTSFEIDGESQPLDVVADPTGGFVVRVPAGTHRVLLKF
jgi:hypothetical protein